MSEEIKKTEEEILFPEAKVGDITIVPWSFGKLFDISSFLEKVLDEIDNKNLNDMFEGSFISYVSMARLFTIASDHLLKIVAITLYKDEEAEFDLEDSTRKVRKFDMSTGIKVAMIIAKQNWETIKNALSPLLEDLGIPEEVGEDQEEKETK